MTGARGTLFLVPNTLDLGTPGAQSDLQETLPLGVIRRAAGLGHWIAENAKSTRAFLKRVDAVIALALPLQAISIVEIPRARKGAAAAANPDLEPLLAPALAGHDIGLISEAGLPAVADPGAAIVAAAHTLGLEVVPLPGASSLLLALAGSGLNGQSFAFVGYLPTEHAARAARIRELDAHSHRSSQTQMVIETPYRNAALLSALLEFLQPTTRLAVSSGLTLAYGFVRSERVSAWRSLPTALPADVPTVFAWLAD